MSAITPLLIGVDEAAELLGISPKTLRHAIAFGRPAIPLTSAKIGGRRLFRLADVERYVAELFGDAPEPPEAEAEPVPAAKRRRGRPRLAAASQ